VNDAPFEVAFPTKQRSMSTTPVEADSSDQRSQQSIESGRKEASFQNQAAPPATQPTAAAPQATDRPWSQAGALFLMHEPMLSIDVLSLATEEMTRHARSAR